MSNYRKTNWEKFQPVEVYSLVVSGSLKRFPNGYLDKDNCKEIIRYVLLDTLHMTREEICEKISINFLKKYRIGCFNRMFNYKIADIASYCFPEMDIRPWELTKVDNKFWHNPDNRREFLLWVAQKEKLDMTNINDVRKINANLLRKHGGSRSFRDSDGVFSVISLVTGDSIKEWELVKMSKWTEAKAIEAMHWLIEEKLGWTDEEVYNNLTVHTFYEYNLGGLLKNYCGHRPLRALEIAYPGKFTSLATSSY